MTLIQLVQASQGGAPLWLQFLIACVPAALALGGVFWSLRHARVLADRERVLTMKREVYMTAAEAMATGSLALAFFVNIDVPAMEVMSGYTARAPAIAKVNVIADSELAAALSGAVRQLASATMKLHHARLAIDALIRDAVELERLGASMQTSIEATLASMQSYNLDGIPNPRRFEVLQQNFKFSSEQKAAMLAQASDKRKQSLPLVVDMVRAWELEAASMGLHMVPVLAAARKELELPFDRDAYIRLFEAQTKAARVELRKYVAGLPPVDSGGAATSADGQAKMYPEGDDSTTPPV
jgi:hypothetical protein